MRQAPSRSLHLRTAVETTKDAKETKGWASGNPQASTHTARPPPSDLCSLSSVPSPLPPVDRRPSPGFVSALLEPCRRFRVALGWLRGGFRVAISWLSTGLGVALMSHEVALPLANSISDFSACPAYTALNAAHHHVRLHPRSHLQKSRLRVKLRQSCRNHRQSSRHDHLRKTLRSCRQSSPARQTSPRKSCYLSSRFARRSFRQNTCRPRSSRSRMSSPGLRSLPR